MPKKFFLASLVFLFFFLFLTPVYASSLKDNEDAIPEKEGVYDVPGRAGLKVRVFVHQPKIKISAAPVLVCGLTDPDSVAVVGPTGWHLSGGTWQYWLNTSSAPANIRLNLNTLVTNSFNAWSATNVGKTVSFTNVGTTRINRKSLDGKNIIAWGKTSGTALAVAYTWYYPSTGLVAETDTILNQRVPWNWSNFSTSCADTNSYDAQDILTHELGHWMGLTDVYDATNYQNATMYGYGSKGEIKKDTLSTGDILGISAVYP